MTQSTYRDLLRDFWGRQAEKDKQAQQQEEKAEQEASKLLDARLKFEQKPFETKEGGEDDKPKFGGAQFAGVLTGQREEAFASNPPFILTAPVKSVIRDGLLGIIEGMVRGPSAVARRWTVPPSRSNLRALAARWPPWLRSKAGER